MSEYIILEVPVNQPPVEKEVKSKQAPKPRKPVDNEKEDSVNKQGLWANYYVFSTLLILLVVGIFKAPLAEFSDKALYKIDQLTKAKNNTVSPAQLPLGRWKGKVSTELLQRVTLFEQLSGCKMTPSKASGAIGRNKGKTRHNAKRYGEVRAIDFMPENCKFKPREWVKWAKQSGFKGIGIYPNWKPRPGIHLDVRKTFRIATWADMKEYGEKKHRYVSLRYMYRKLGK